MAIQLKLPTFNNTVLGNLLLALGSLITEPGLAAEKVPHEFLKAAVQRVQDRCGL